MNRRWKILSYVAMALGVAIVLAYIHHLWLSESTEAYIAQLKARGEPLELAQVIPPPVPLKQNGAVLITNALTKLDGSYNKSICQTNPPPAMREVSLGKAMVGWQQPNIVGFNNDDLATLSTNARLSTNTWEDLGKELAASESELDSFQSLTNHPILDFNLNYTEDYSMGIEHLAPLTKAARWLSAAALYDLHERKTAKACADTRMILAIAQGQTTEPLEISQLVRSSVANIAAETTWEILQDPDVSESELASLQREWESLEFIDPAKKAYLAERVINLNSLKSYLQHPSGLWRTVNGSRSGIEKKSSEFLWRWFWVYADEKRMMQTYQVLVEAMQTAEANHSLQSAQSFARTNLNRLGFERPFPQEGTFRIDIDPIDVHWLFSENAFDSYILLKRTMVFETVRNMTTVAIALKQYQLKYHQLPPTLRPLTPEFLKMVPIDYMNGQALHYQKKPGGTFLLYSVGENGQDDGGKASFHKWWEFYWCSHNNDLVWPQPATPEEIQAFFARQKSSD